MNKTLVVIDYTNDFVADNGALTVRKPAQALDQRISELIDEFAKAGEYIAVVNDFHQVNDFVVGTQTREGKLFPPHNIKDTPGRNVYGKTGEILKTVVHEKFDKTLYDALTGYFYEEDGWAVTLDEILYNSNTIQEVHLVGVCTDICVLHTAIGLYNADYKVVVHEDGVASFNQAGHEWALGHFKNTLGADVVKDYKF